MKTYHCMDCSREIGYRHNRCRECSDKHLRDVRKRAAGEKGNAIAAGYAHAGFHTTPVPTDVVRRFEEWRGQTRAHSILNAGTVTQGQRLAIAAECEDEEYRPFQKRERLPSRGVATCPYCSRVRYAGIACRCGRKENEE